MSQIFLGLQPYTEGDSYRFKGRQNDARILFEQVMHNEYTICYAESGEGKTSLINAGLYPLLRSSLYFPINISFNQEDFKNINIDFDEIVLKRIDEAFETYRKDTGNQVKYEMSSSDFSEYDAEKRDSIVKQVQTKSWWKLRNYKPQISGIDLIPVFVFDQFEEVFDRPKSVVWTQKFFTWLETISKDLCPDEIISLVRAKIGRDVPFPEIKKSKDFKAVFSLRNEYIGDLDYWCMQKFFIPDLKNNRFCLKPLTINGAKEIMEQGEFDTQTMSDVIKNLAGNEYSDSEQKIPCISALLLSIVCTSLSDNSDIIKQSLALQDNQIDLINYIINVFYQQSIENLRREIIEENDTKIYEKVRIPSKHLKIIEQALIGDNGKRLRISTSTRDLQKIDFIDNYLEPLKKGRIIRISHFEGQDYIELIHDQLAKVISERVKKRTSQRVKSSITVSLLVLLAIMAFVTLKIIVKDSSFDKHSLPTVELYAYEINHASTNTNIPMHDKCVEELHLRLANHSMNSLRQLKKLYVENNKSHQSQITISDCPLLDEIHIDCPISELVLNINDSINANVFINSDLKKIIINNSKSILTFIVPEKNKEFIWHDNVLWDSKGVIIYLDHNKSNKIEFPKAYKDKQSVWFNGKKYQNSIFTKKVNDEYRFDTDVITREDVEKHPAKKVIITHKVRIIEEEAFKYQDSLYEVVFDTNCIIKIGNRAFAYCKNINKVTLPFNIDNIIFPWWENPFLDCHNINFIVHDSPNSQLYNNNGVIWKRGNINMPLFFSNNAHDLDGINNSYIEPNIITKGACFYKLSAPKYYKQSDGLYCRLLICTNSTEINGSDIIDTFISDTTVSAPVFEIYNTRQIKKIHIHRFLPDYEIRLADSDKSEIILVVPKGCKSYFENDDNFKGFRRIEEEKISLWQPYVVSIKSIWEYTYYYIQSYWIYMLPIMIVVVICFSVIIDFFNRFNNRKKGKESLSFILRVLSIMSCLLLSFTTYTIFYWLLIYTLFTWDNLYALLWSNFIAITIAVFVSLAILYLRNVSCDWKLFKIEMKSSWKRTKIIIKSYPNRLTRHIKRWWMLYLCICLIVLDAVGIYLGVKTLKSHRDIDKMVKAQDWKRVSKIVYNKIMDADSIDDIDRSWVRTMLLATNQDTISSSCYYNNYRSSYSYMVYIDGSNYYVIDLNNIYQEPFEIEDLSSKQNVCLETIINDRYLLARSNTHLYYYDMKSQKMLFDKKIGQVNDKKYFDSGMCWCDRNSSWRKKHSQEAANIFIFNGNTLTLDSIQVPSGYDYIGDMSVNRYLSFGKGWIVDGFYDIKTKTIIQKTNNVAIYPHFIRERHGDTTIVISSYLGELRKDTIDDSKCFYSIFVGSNYLLYTDTKGVIQYMDFVCNRKTGIGKGTIMFKSEYDKFTEDSLLIISKSDTLIAFKLAAGKPIRLANEVIKNRIQYYGEGGKNLYNVMKKGIFASKTNNNTIRFYNLITKKEIKTFNAATFDFQYINDNFIIKYGEKHNSFELYPLDGTPIEIPIIVKLKRQLGKYESINSIGENIILTPYEIFVLPSFEQTINNNLYLNESQKAKLIKKLKETCK